MLSLRTIPPLLLIFAVSLWTPRMTRAQGTLAGDLPPPKSEDHALRLGVLGTGVPIVAGAAIAILGVSHQTYGVNPYTGMTIETSHRWGLGVGIVAAGAGVILGPTLGYLYAGRVGGLPIRLLLPVAGVAVAAIPASSCTGGEDCGLEAAAIGFGVGCGLALVDAGYDLVRLKGVVRRKNEWTRHASVHLIPSYLKSTEQPALAVQLRF
jgi:hypothetical protein